MFEHCYFIIGQNNTIVIVIPTHLPDADVFTVSVTENEVEFSADYEPIAQVPYQDNEIYSKFKENTQVGMIEYEEAKKGPMPQHITHLAYVEIWEGLA